jgi:hypothetical protein
VQRTDRRYINTGAAQQHSQKEIPVLQQSPILDGGTTRRFPRTLNEAFGCDGHCITHYRNRWSWVNRAAVFALWVLAVAWGTTLWI